MKRIVRVGGLCAAVAFGWAATVFAQNTTTTTRISVGPGGNQANDVSYAASISADGRYLAFHSLASNLVPNDTNNDFDVFLRDRQTGTIERVDVVSGGAQVSDAFNPKLSADGRFILFRSSATTLVAGDTNNVADVFLRDRQTNTNTRISVSTGGGEASGPSHGGYAISDDGRFVAFGSEAANLVPDDTNAGQDVFLRDRQAGTTVRVSVGAGASQGNAASHFLSMSANGRYIVFASAATNLVASDTNGVTDIFVRDVQAGTTTRVSVGPGGEQGNSHSHNATVSADGRFVAFETFSRNFTVDFRAGIFVHDRELGITSLLVAESPLDVFVREFNDRPLAPQITRDGRIVCFKLLDLNNLWHVMRIDRQTLVQTPVSSRSDGVTSAGTGGHVDCAPNADGSVIAFSSDSPDLVENDSNGVVDVFVRTLGVTSLTFGAVTNGAAFVSQTATQTIQLAAASSAQWTASSNQLWLQVSPATGIGPATLSISVRNAPGLPTNGTLTGTITVRRNGATEPFVTISVTLTVKPGSSSTSPFGTVDTPTDNRTGVTGAVPFTGWALDDVEVTRVSICRGAFGGEVAPVDPNCGGAAEVFVGFATFVEGARPDVAGGYASYPHASRAGWGFMLLTNMLPGQGNGTYSFTMRAQDREGRWFVLGRRTMTCANASATLPFGTIDTPLQGGTASGNNYVNFGWALTPQPKTIPTDGSTIQVFVDGVSVGTADYNHARSDIQAAFPGYNNTNGAVGFRVLDTTAMPNGLHTIAWVVTDNQGAVEGIGSRFFTVSNGVTAVTAASTRAEAGLDSTTLDTSPLAGRRGWNLEAPYGLFGANANGVTVIRSEEVSRIELQLGQGMFTGYLRVAGGLAPLPIGARLDAATNTFTWAPGVAFVGPYDFVFARSVNGRAVSRREVRIVLQPKARGAVGPQVVIDIPASKSAVREPFAIGGWAVDLDAIDGTGVTTLHAWAYPASGGAPIFLGATEYGGARPDIAAVHGERFKPSGFGLIVQGLPAGDYDLALFAWSTETMGFVAPKILRVTVTP